MKWVFTILCATVFNIFNYASDSLVVYSELTFHSNLEKTVFDNYFKNQNENYLDLFFALDPNENLNSLTSAKKRFEDLLSTFNEKKLSKRAGERKIVYLYSGIHDEMLQKYETINHFSEIFSSGVYNCVSATALYSLAFEHFELPYVIRETPTHVYIIGYPESDKILVETTNPLGGFNMYNDSYQKEFVKNLNKSKLISDTEFEESNYRDLFDKYYFNDDDISLKELVGIQYSNDAIYRIENEDHIGAYHQLEKAFLFKPSERIARMLLLSGIKVLEQARNSDVSLWVNMISKLSRFSDYGLSREFVEGEFYNFMLQVLVRQGKDESFEKYYSHLIKSISDQELKSSIIVLANNERARLKFNEGNYLEALEFYKISFKENESNINTKNLLVKCIIEVVSTANNSEEIVSYLENTQTEFPQIKDHTHFKSALGLSYLNLFSNYFKFENPSLATKYQLKFEEVYLSDQVLNISTSAIAEAYSDAAVYFFKRNNKKKALDFIDAGLKVIPGNFELIQRRRVLE